MQNNAVTARELAFLIGMLSSIATSVSVNATKLVELEGVDPKGLELIVDELEKACQLLLKLVPEDGVLCKSS
jgi:hypothetical protein